MERPSDAFFGGGPRVDAADDESGGCYKAVHMQFTFFAFDTIPTVASIDLPGAQTLQASQLSTLASEFM